jgi:hypothetical protein
MFVIVKALCLQKCANIWWVLVSSTCKSLLLSNKGLGSDDKEQSSWSGHHRFKSIVSAKKIIKKMRKRFAGPIMDLH